MKKIKLLIVDDEPLAHQVLAGYCEKLEYVEVVGNCYDGMPTLNFLNKYVVDAVLLDIQMPDLTGLELLDTLKNNAPKVIFTTAYTEYVLQGFDYDQVVDYLHKPIRLTRFIKAIERLKRILQLESSFEEQPVVPVSESSPADDREFMSIRDNKVVYRILYKEILYIQSWGNYLKIFLANDDVKIVRKTIKIVESELPTRQFIRIHKSYIVNLHHIISLEGNQIKIKDQKLPIGKSYQVSVKSRMGG